MLRHAVTWNDWKPAHEKVASISGFPISREQVLFRPGRPIKNFVPFMEVNKKENFQLCAFLML